MSRLSPKKIVFGSLGWLLVVLVAVRASGNESEEIQERRQRPSRLIDGNLSFYVPGIRPEQILRSRGYTAEVHYFITEDNYQLKVVRGINPLLRGRSRANKLPILFIHGVLTTHASWLLNSQFVRPKLYGRKYDLSNMTSAQVYELVKDDPARHSLPFLAMNFGHEIWLLGMRGYVEGSRQLVGRPDRTLGDAIADIPESLAGGGFSLGAGLQPGTANRVPIESVDFQRIGSPNITGPLNYIPPEEQVRLPVDTLVEAIRTALRLPSSLAQIGDLRQQLIDTFDPDFWRFSVDQQAEFDFPEAINFVLRKSRRRQLHLVSYSLGGAVTLLGLSLRPELSEKVSRCVLYAPAINTGAPGGINIQLSQLNPIFQSYIGPFPQLFQVQPLRTLIQQVCNSELSQRTLCESVADLVVGPSAGQAPLTQAIIADLFAPTASRDLLQLGQFARTDVPHRFNFSRVEQNLQVYGQPEPPAYDLGRITLQNISIYAGQNDFLVEPGAVATTVTQLNVPVELYLIGDERVFFNHLGNLIHEKNDQLILIPSLIDIARSEAARGRRQNGGGRG